MIVRWLRPFKSSNKTVSVDTLAWAITIIKPNATVVAHPGEANVVSARIATTTLIATIPSASKQPVRINMRTNITSVKTEMPLKPKTISDT